MPPRRENSASGKSKKKERNAKQKEQRATKKEARKKADVGFSDMIELSIEQCLTASRDVAQLFERLNSPPKPVAEAVTIMRILTEMTGTDLELNDSDPYGDGDQRFVGANDMSGAPVRQILARMYAEGGDIASHLLYPGGFSDFALHCASGNAAAVEKTIIAVTEEGSLRGRRELLERRESGLRLSPILITVANSKNPDIVASAFRMKRLGTMRVEDMDHIGVIRVLLKYGARPDSKDLTGKTISHYATGGYATEETLTMHDYCWEANKTSSHFGHTVIVRNLLNKPEYNGLKGILGGYLATTKRRQVTLLGEGPYSGKVLALQPKNIFCDRSSDEKNEACILSNDDSSVRNLVNIIDRTGSLSIHEAFASQRVDVVTYLTEKCRVSIDTTDHCEGVGDSSLRTHAFTMNPFCLSTMSKLIRKYAMECDKERMQKTCAQCHKVLLEDSLLVCSRCKVTLYCSTDCQKNHWEGVNGATAHRHQCKPQELYIKLSVNLGDGYDTLPITNLFTGEKINKICYNQPKGVGIDEKFWIQVQVDGVTESHLLYDKTRTCLFFLNPNTPGHRELYDKAKSQIVVSGYKTYVQALFDTRGICRVYPNTSTLKKW